MARRRPGSPREHRFSGGCGVAHEVLLLSHDPSTVLLLDFAGVEDVSHGFADELLSPLNDLLHEAVGDRVWPVNCADEVPEEFEPVALMHGLVMPGARRDGIGSKAGC
jgi:hypothetical protein